MTLADTAASSAAQAVGDKAADAIVSSATAVQSATDAAAEVVQRDNGWFGFFTGPFETVLKVAVSVSCFLSKQRLNIMEDACAVSGSILSMTTSGTGPGHWAGQAACALFLWILHHSFDNLR